MRSSALAALAASLTQVSAVYQGFNYGASNSDGSPKTLATFTQEFNTAKNLVGTSGFSSARLYTSIQAGSSTNEFIQAIPAAINTGTTLLLGIWASAGQGHIDAELIALKSAIAQYGTSFTSIVAGLSIGSEDLYRISPTGIKAKSGYGADPDTLVKYIGQVRSALAGTPLAGVKIGHVDTWTAWVNGTNSAVINAVDWLGVDAYPYFQNTESNGIENNAKLFNDAFAATAGVAGGKDVYITETGFPVSGPTENLAVPSLANAKAYWNAVGCANFGKVNTWWYTLFDAPSAPSFGIVGSGSSTTPLFDLTCSAVSSSSSVAASSSAPPSSSSSAAATSAPTASSAASAAPTGLASSGGGLSPSQGGGIVSQPNSAAATPSSTGLANSASPSVSASRSTITTVIGAGNATATGATTSRPATTSATLGSGANPVSFSLAASALALVFAVMSVL